MNWVKAIKKLPSKDGVYVCKFYKDKLTALGGVERLEFNNEEGGFMTEHDEYFNLEWLDESNEGEERKFTLEEKDNFAISFAVWVLHDLQAKAYLNSGCSAYQLLEKYKDRPFIDTDTSKQ